MLGHSAITGAPLTSIGSWLTVDPTQSTATVDASVDAGDTVSIEVQSVGSDGNPWTSGGHTVVVSVTGANTATPVVTDNGDGTYTASYTATNAGVDSVAITLDGTAISGSPYGVTVAAPAGGATGRGRPGMNMGMMMGM